MKRNISLILAIVLFFFTVSCTTFPVKSAPGLYVNGWPVFSISYPAEWQEKTPAPQQMFRVEAAGGTPSLRIGVFSNMGMPLAFTTRIYMAELLKIGTDVKVISEKETALSDGTSAYETEVEWTPNFLNGIKLNSLFVTAQKENLWINVSISVSNGSIGEDLKQVAYSLKIKPGEDKIIKVPSDIQDFLDQYSVDVVNHDMGKVMSHFSDRYLHNGVGKAGVENFYKMVLTGILSFEINITKYERLEENAFLAGFIVSGNMKFPLNSDIVKENSKWKFFGNQKQGEI